MKKLIASIIAGLVFLCNNEIVTMVVLALAGLFFVGFLLFAWAKHDPPKMPGSFDTDWVKK